MYSKVFKPTNYGNTGTSVKYVYHYNEYSAIWEVVKFLFIASFFIFSLTTSERHVLRSSFVIVSLGARNFTSSRDSKDGKVVNSQHGVPTNIKTL